MSKEAYELIIEGLKSGEFKTARQACAEFNVDERVFSTYKNKHYPDLFFNRQARLQAKTKRSKRKKSPTVKTTKPTKPTKPTAKPTVLEIPKKEKKKELSVVILKGDSEEITKALKNMF